MRWAYSYVRPKQKQEAFANLSLRRAIALRRIAHFLFFLSFHLQDLWIPGPSRGALLFLFGNIQEKGFQWLYADNTGSCNNHASLTLTHESFTIITLICLYVHALYKAQNLFFLVFCLIA